MACNSEFHLSNQEVIRNVYRYVGLGFVPGVPARDLTELEYELFEEKLKEHKAEYLYQKEEVTDA